MTEKTYKYLLYSLLIFIPLLIFSYFYYPLVSADSGFYLAIAKEFYNGKIYFQEIGISYNPLSIIVLGIPFLFTQNPSYIWHLAINFLIIFSSSIVFYKILNQITSNQKYNSVAALFFILGSLILDGRYLVLEPLSILFQLLGTYLYFIFKKSNRFHMLIWVGFFICLAFLSKQYGLFILAPIVIDILITKKIVVKRIAFLSIGLIIPLVLFYLYLNQINLTIYQFISYILGKGPMLDIGTGTGIELDVLSYVTAPFIFILKNLYLILIPILFWKNKSRFNNEKYFYFIAFLCSVLPLIFAIYSHYFQYVLPFSLLLYSYMLKFNSNQKLEKLGVFLFSISFFVICSVSVISFSRKNNQLLNQQEAAKIISSHIPVNSQVYLDGLNPAYYYLCQLQSINLKDISYTFPGYFYPETIVNNLKPNSYIIVSENRYDLYKHLINNPSTEPLVLFNKKYIIIKAQ
jgi:hypothetical protein